MTERLEWWRISATHYQAGDTAMFYTARRDKQGIWRLRMNGAPIGERGGFPTFEAARDYVDWGGTPNRMGYDRETGESF